LNGGDGAVIWPAPGLHGLRRYRLLMHGQTGMNLLVLLRVMHSQRRSKNSDKDDNSQKFLDHKH